MWHNTIVDFDVGEYKDARKGARNGREGRVRMKKKSTVDVAIAHGNDIRARRLAKGWTQRQLARAANLSEGYISKIENGGVRISKNNARAIAGALRHVPKCQWCGCHVDHVLQVINEDDGHELDVCAVCVKDYFPSAD
jgi:transcriptional regulator with XRE-family HTH domain